jgi:hypothetical protein
MKRDLSWRRYLAGALLRLGSLLLPAQRSSWIAVMYAEVRHIDDDREALNWALGGVRAGATERLRGLGLQRLLSARGVGILWIIIFVLSSAFNVSITLAARLGHERMASALGWWLKGFQYDRFLSLAEAMPIALYLLMTLVLALFIASLYLSLRNRPGAFAAFCCAIGLSLLAWLYQLGLPAYIDALSSQHRWRIGICFVLTVGVLGAMQKLQRGQT